MKHMRIYNVGVYAVAGLLAVILIAKPSSGSIRLVSVSGCAGCDGSVTYPVQASEDTQVRRLISKQGLDPAAFTLAKGVAGDFWISGEKVCTLTQTPDRIRCRPHFQ